MAKKNANLAEIKIKRPKKAKLSAKESLTRMANFDQRKEAFVAAVRKGKNRSVSA